MPDLVQYRPMSEVSLDDLRAMLDGASLNHRSHPLSNAWLFCVGESLDEMVFSSSHNGLIVSTCCVGAQCPDLSVVRNAVKVESSSTFMDVFGSMNGSWFSGSFLVERDDVLATWQRSG